MKIDLPTAENPVVVIHGDCLEVLPHIPAGVVDAVVTDPPYGVDFQGKNTKHTHRDGSGYSSGVDDAEIGPRVVSECLKRYGRAAVFAPARNAFDYPKPVEIGSVFCPSGAGLGRWGFIGTHPILYYGKCPYLESGKGHRPNSMRSFATSEENGHPCPKPVEWMRFLVAKASLPSQTILDPFAGSGTTAVAAILEGRRCILIEKDARYVEICRQRVAKALCEDKGNLFKGVAQGDLFAD